MQPPIDLPIERLLEHAGWVRTLARRLADDGPGADDLEQTTWLAALEHPPGPDQPVRRWLAAVLRNVARQSGRGAGRRREHEARAARSEALPSAADVVERASVQREVVEAVLALDEPYRTAVLLRWFEGLAPREIAAELGLSVETVHTRLQRGHARLRARLDARHGGDRGAWALVPFAASTTPPLGPLATTTSGPVVSSAISPAVPLASGSSVAAGPLAPLSGIALGAILMNAKLKLGLLAALLLALATAWYVTSEAPESTPALASAPTAMEIVRPDARAVDVRAASPVESVAVASKSERATASTSAHAEPVPPAAALPALLHGRVLDARGSPASGVAIGLEAGSETTDLSTRSGTDGRFELAPPTRAGRLVATSPAIATVLAGMYSPGPGRSEVIVVVATRATVAGRVVDEDGNAIEGAEIAVELPDNFRTRFTQVLDFSVDVARGTKSDAEGRFAIDAVPLVEGAAVVAKHDGFDPFRTELASFSGEGLVITLARPRAPDGLVRGRVVDLSGAPVEGARVAFGVASTTSASDGGFSFAIEDPRSMNARFDFVPTTLVAVKRGSQPARYEAPTSGGKPAWPPSVVLKLGDPPLSIAGRVVDHRGEPISDAMVWVADATFFGDGGRGPAQVENILAGEDEAFWHFVETDEGGAFEIDGLLAREYRVRAMDPKTLLRAEEGPIAAGARGAEIRLATDTLIPRVAGRIVSHSGDPIAKVRVFPMCDAFQARFQGRIVGTSHDALEGVVTDAEGRFELENVPKSLVYLRIQGEDILPLEYGRYVEGDARFANSEVKELPLAKIENLVIAVDRRCHFQVELADPTVADELAVLDASGAALVINTFVGNGRREDERAPIVEGRSHPMAVSDSGKTIVLYRAGLEVTRTTLELAPGELKQVKL